MNYFHFDWRGDIVHQDNGSYPPVSAMITLISGPNCSTETLKFFTDGLLITDVLYCCKIGVALLGALLNLVSLIIFCKTSQKNVFLMMLILLSVAEVIYGFGAVIFELYYLLFVVHNYHLANVAASLFSGYFVLYAVWMLYKTSLITRNWMIVLIAWRRYRAIIDPITTHRTLSQKNIRMIFFIIYLCSFAITTPRGFEIGYEICEASSQICGYGESHLMKSSEYVLFYHTFFFVCTSPIPIFIVMFCSFAMLHSLRQRDTTLRAPSGRATMTSSDSERRSMNQGQTPTTSSSSTSTTRTVFILCGAFFCCELPMFIAGILERFEQTAGVFGGVANSLTNLDSVLNFIVYYSSMKSFKEEIKKACLGRKSHVGNNRNSVIMSDMNGSVKKTSSKRNRTDTSDKLVTKKQNELEPIIQ